jgi:Protein of unknown function (DUF3043)
MFGRRKAAGSTPAVQERVGAKNRPTPKRSVAQAANKRPLVPTDRKVAGKSSREQVRSQRNQQRAAMLSGDERHLPARDQGPEKRFIRDYVDARYSVGEFLLPVVAVVFLATITRLPIAVFITTIIVYGVILAVLADSLLLRRRLTKAMKAKFGAAPRGLGFYAVTRTLQIRRWRMPRPQVGRGDYPS